MRTAKEILDSAYLSSKLKNKVVISEIDLNLFYIGVINAARKEAIEECYEHITGTIDESKRSILKLVDDIR